MKRSTRLAAATAAVTLAGLVGAGLGVSHRRNDTAASARVPALPASPAPALKIGAPDRLSSGRFFSRWTVVRTAGPARARPAAGAPVIARLAEQTAEGMPNALPVLRSKPDRSGRLWVEVRLPMLPNGRVGWVKRRMLAGYETVNTHLFVDREHLRATLYRSGQAVFTAPVGIGSDSSPTPAGAFMIRNELTRYASPFYGPVAFGTTARSAVLTDWPAGGFVGIHGTNEPELIPGRVSHGCIRLRNRDILRLAALMPVGTPMTIR
jgi:lipoprotein-anchoring transpeptidase ErfK/SrfK